MNSAPEMTSFSWLLPSAHRHTNHAKPETALGAKRQNWLAMLAACLLFPGVAWPQAPKPILQADERYKVDILLVVAHPDDEGAATPYLARAIDEGKRVAVAYGTRGSSGENQAGA